MTERPGANVLASLLWTAIASSAILLQPVSGEAVGWRMDGTGNYTDCHPPGEIGPEVNVLWKAPLANWSHASPVLVQGRVFICAEPYDLLCVDAENGQILWQKANGYYDLADPSPEMARRIGEEVRQDSVLIVEEKQIAKAISKLRRKSRADTSNVELKAQIKAKNSEIKAVKVKRDALLLAGKSRDWPTHKTNGYASRTLASDGERVIGAFGNGMVVCYDLDGNLVWHAQHKPIFHDWGGSTSPTVVGDRAIVHYDDHYYAHRVSDGKELWRVKAKLSYGTPDVAYLGEAAILVTPQGLLLDVEKGEAVGEPAFKPLPYSTPVVVEGVVYAVGHKDTLCTAVQLPESLGELRRDGAKVLWAKKIKKDRYYGSPVLHGGLLYVITRNHTLTVLDAETGETVYAQRVPRIKGQTYMSPTVAGKRLYLNGEKGSMVVLQTGREFVEKARVQFAPFRTTPIFVGDRMFLRTSEFLYCFQQK